MPGLFAWMLGIEYDRALRITASSSGYWTPTATDDLLALPGVTGYLGLKPVSERELEVLWVEEGSPGAMAWAMAEDGNWSRISASTFLALYPALRVGRNYIMRIPYVVREKHMYLQLDQWRAIPSMPRGYTTAHKPRPLRRLRKSNVKK
jgi:hypothetical protein